MKQRPIITQLLCPFVAILLLPSVLPGFTESAVDERRPAISPEARARIRQAIAAVGLILVRRFGEADQRPRPRGSAVVVRPDGVVATTYHVIAEESSDRLYDELFFSLSNEEGSSPTASHQYRLKAI